MGEINKTSKPNSILQNIKIKRDQILLDNKKTKANKSDSLTLWTANFEVGKIKNFWQYGEMSPSLSIRKIKNLETDSKNCNKNPNLELPLFLTWDL